MSIISWVYFCPCLRTKPDGGSFKQGQKNLVKSGFSGLSLAMKTAEADFAPGLVIF